MPVPGRLSLHCCTKVIRRKWPIWRRRVGTSRLISLLPSCVNNRGKPREESRSVSFTFMIMPKAPSTQDSEVIITRTVNAPRDLVWEVWTDPAHLARWWGPNGFSITTHDFEFRKGGEWNFIMHGPDGRDYPNKIV